MSAAIAEVADLWYAYPDAADEPSPWVLQGVNLRLARGELVCLLGPSGAGKSTLALAMLGIVPQATGGRIRGRVLLDGLDTKRTPVAELATRAGLVFQDPETQFLQPSVEAEVAFGLENLGVSPQEIRDRVGHALRRVGLQGFERRSPHELSGGEKQRVAIASVAAMEPDLLVMDEPTAGLDPAGKAQVREAVQELRGERAALVVTQDSEWAAETADRVLVLENGRVEMEGTPEAVFSEVPELARRGLRAPQVSELAHCLNQRGGGGTYRFVRLEQAARHLERARVG